MADYQARRLNIRYKANDGRKGYVYMNDATAFALGRTLVAIIENNQQADGSIKVPTVLQKWVGKEVIK
jgi:seryl-tRNA synthetase